MILFKHINRKNWWKHLVFWFGVWALYIYFFSYPNQNWKYAFWFSTALLPVTFMATSFFINGLIPRFLLKKQYSLFALYSIYTLIFCTFFTVISIVGSLFWFSNYSFVELPLITRNIFFILLLMYLVIGLVSFYELLQQNYRQMAYNQDLENQMLTAQLQLKEQELTYLKSQMHPHFLFNTLNTIYGFSLKKSEETPDMILKLSSLLDYSLYQVQQPQVSLEQELNHIQDYIDLENIRFKEILQVEFNIEGNVQYFQIPPMLLMPFVENAFKHGSVLKAHLLVKIDLTIDEKQLTFCIENTVNEKRIKPSSGGIGLKNIKKRLNILYPNQHHLVIENENDWFKVKLEIFNLQVI